MAEHVHKRHNKSFLIYHIVLPGEVRKERLHRSVATDIETCVFGTGNTVRDRISRDQHRRRSRPFSHPISSKRLRSRSCQTHQKHYRQTSIRAASEGEEVPVRRQLLDDGLLRQYGRPVRQSRHAAELRTKTRPQRLHTTTPPDALLVRLIYTGTHTSMLCIGVH